MNQGGPQAIIAKPGAPYKNFAELADYIKANPGQVVIGCSLGGTTQVLFTSLVEALTGDANSVNYEVLTYEGYGPSGVAVIVDTLTDNKNRTAANVRSAFTKGNGSIGTQGCVSFMFDQKGQIIIDKEELEDKKLKLDVANGWVSLFKFAWWVLAAITGAVVDSLAGNPIGNLIRRLIE